MTITTITLLKGSASTDARGVKIVATATPGTALHTFQASTATGCFDLVDVTVFNSDTAARTVTFECGGATSPDDKRGGSIPAGEERTFYDFMGRNATSLAAFASAANVLSAHVRVRQHVVA